MRNAEDLHTVLGIHLRVNAPVDTSYDSNILFTITKAIAKNSRATARPIRTFFISQPPLSVFKLNL